jgi:sarcosine oxidase gamma subunit
MMLKGGAYMNSKLQKENAVDAEFGFLAEAGLSLKENINSSLWNVQGNAVHSLESFSLRLFDHEIVVGETLTRKGLRLIRLSPHSVYLHSDNNDLPDLDIRFETMLTDVSHGFCDLSLSGEQSFEFLNSYLSVNLNTAPISEAQVVRAGLGQFETLLWWEQRDTIHMLIDRSYAQSFGDYLNNLSQRWAI